MCSNCTGELQAGTGISGRYQGVPRTIYVREYRVCRCTRGCGWCCCRSEYINVCIAYLHTYVLRTYLVWRTWKLSYLGVVVVVDAINVGGWCCCRHLFRVGTNLLRTYVPGMAYLGVVVHGSSSSSSSSCCFPHTTTYLVRVLKDDDCYTDEGTPPPAHPAHGLTVK